MLNIPYLGFVPMNTKTILGISLAAVFAISMFASQSVLADDPVPEYRQITDTKVTVATDSDGGVLKAEIKTEDKIPKKGKGSEGAFGFGLATGALVGDPVLALTTHLCVADTPVQGVAKAKDCAEGTVGLLDALFGSETTSIDEMHNDAKFHAHMLILKAPTAACPANTAAEVDIGASASYQLPEESEDPAGPYLSPDWKVKVKGHKITVGNVPTDALLDAGVERIVSYGIVGLADATTTVTNLCLTDLHEQ